MADDGIGIPELGEQLEGMVTSSKEINKNLSSVDPSGIKNIKKSADGISAALGGKSGRRGIGLKSLLENKIFGATSKVSAGLKSLGSRANLETKTGRLQNKILGGAGNYVSNKSKELQTKANAEKGNNIFDIAGSQKTQAIASGGVGEGFSVLKDAIQSVSIAGVSIGKLLTIPLQLAEGTLKNYLSASQNFENLQNQESKARLLNLKTTSETFKNFNKTAKISYTRGLALQNQIAENLRGVSDTFKELIAETSGNFSRALAEDVAKGDVKSLYDDGTAAGGLVGRAIQESINGLEPELRGTIVEALASAKLQQIKDEGASFRLDSEKTKEYKDYTDIVSSSRNKSVEEFDNSEKNKKDLEKLKKLEEKSKELSSEPFLETDNKEKERLSNLSKTKKEAEDLKSKIEVDRNAFIEKNKNKALATAGYDADRINKVNELSKTDDISEYNKNVARIQSNKSKEVVAYQDNLTLNKNQTILGSQSFYENAKTAANAIDTFQTALLDVSKGMQKQLTPLIDGIDTTLKTITVAGNALVDKIKEWTGAVDKPTK